MYGSRGPQRGVGALGINPGGRTMAHGDRGSPVQNDEKKERITLVLPKKTIERLGELKERTESSSNVEVFKRAINLLEMVKNEEDAGNQLCFINESGKITVIKLM